MTKYRTAAKSESLGMVLSGAVHTLKKNLLFDLAKKCGENTCFRCGGVIESPADFTIDHKEPWFGKENARELFFDLNNIAFSHSRCNSGAARLSKTVSKTTGYRGVCFVKTYKNKPYRVDAKANGVSVLRKNFSTALEAALAYDEAVIKYQGDRAVTNKSLGLL